MPTSVRRAALGLVAASGVAACGAAGNTREATPTASLAASPDAQEAFRALRQRWQASRRPERATLIPDLRAFLGSYPTDGQARTARAYLALVLADRGEWAEAENEARRVLAGPPGTTRDAADLALAVVQLGRGQATAAFERLAPYVGKIIDPTLRLLFDELIVGAATRSERWYEAIAYMDVWLRDAPDDELAEVVAAVDRALTRIPVHALELTLRTMDAGGSGYGQRIRRAVVGRLAAVALAQKDADLARRVVDWSAATSIGSQLPEGLEALASAGASATVDGHTVGLLIRAGDDPLANRWADVVAGALDAARHLAGGVHVRLITREDTPGTRDETGLAALASQGAAILVAGLSAEGAEAALRFADRTGTPTLLLSKPPEPIDSTAAFLLGERTGAELDVLERALAEQGARRIVRASEVAEAAGAGDLARSSQASTAPRLDVRCDPGQAADPGRFPSQLWREGRVDALAVLGDGECASDALIAAEHAGLTLRVVGLGLFAADPPATHAVARFLRVSAGRFPLVRRDASSPLAAFRDRNGAAPRWATVLGHDAITLAALALTRLPEDRARVADEVAARHATAASALARSKVELWSTDAPGFGGAHVLPRTLTAHEVEP